MNLRSTIDINVAHAIVQLEEKIRKGYMRVNDHWSGAICKSHCIYPETIMSGNIHIFAMNGYAPVKSVYTFFFNSYLITHLKRPIHH